MACEQCGGDGTQALPGTTCRECGTAGGTARHEWAGDPRPGRSTGRALRGRLLLLSRRNKLLLTGAVVVAVAALTVSAADLYGNTSQASEAPGDGPAGGAGDDIGDLGGAPQRIAPADPPSDASSPPPVRATPKPPAKVRPPEEARGPAYSAWAGPGCTGGGLYREENRFSDGDDGWYTVSSGGHRGDGCDGRFTAVPMSGRSTKDGGGRATWSWYVGSGYDTCSVAVVVPDSGRDRDVAGRPTTYNVLSDPDDPGSVVKVFEIDQTELRGSGLVVEKVPVHDQKLTVQLVDRGEDQGDDDGGGAHHAAAQMRAECRA
ncbi:adhesin [Streptomyces sp. NPDC006540]|uniref:adhesin n=1 Tax=Streptomyces sp. NPDC006540 TaxID=3155353 RepID=UPI0033AC9C05